MTPSATLPLNAAIVVRLDGDLAPLSVGPFSVSLRDDGGADLPARFRVEAGALAVYVAVDEALFARAPLQATLRLAGVPSPAALETTDGRLLERPVRVPITLTRALEDASGAPRLIALDGHPVPLPGTMTVGPVVSLLFDGVLDPDSISAESCPLLRTESGLSLPDPLHPTVRWRCEGRRFELQLEPGASAWSDQPLRLELRRFRVRGPGGSAPEPALAVDLVTS